MKKSACPDKGYADFLLCWLCLLILSLCCLVLLFESGFHESFEEWMRPVRSGFEFRMCLCRNEPRMGRDFDHFDDAAVRRESAQRHSMFLQDVAVIVVHFIAVAVAFADLSLVPYSFSAREPSLSTHGYAPRRRVPPISSTPI